MDNLETAYEKLSYLKKALILETKADAQFELKHQISELEKEIKEIPSKFFQ